MVFDEIGGRWVAVTLGSDQCKGATAEFWQVFTLQPRPDGTLAGDYTAVTQNLCADRRTVTFTRTGDVDVNNLPDPAGQPPRVPSPAEALRGQYRTLRTFKSGSPQQQSTSTVTTNCLRTGDRCISYLHGKSNRLPLIFGGGNWTLDIDVDDSCLATGEPTHVNITGQYPLPQPPQDPIRLLTGHGHQRQTGSCALDTDYDETLTRTAD
jgi:serine/threonine-protein kinase